MTAVNGDLNVSCVPMTFAPTSTMRSRNAESATSPRSTCESDQVGNALGVLLQRKIGERARLQRPTENPAEIQAGNLVANDRTADADTPLRVVARVTRQHALVSGRHRGQHAAPQPQAVEEDFNPVPLYAVGRRDGIIGKVQPRVVVGRERVDAGRFAAEHPALLSRRDVRFGKPSDEQAQVLALLADPRGNGDQPAMAGIGDPELVVRTFGE